MTRMIEPRFDRLALQHLLDGGLIVSCQALEGEALFGSAIMAKLAIAAVEGGAVAIRANSPDDVRAIRASVSVPVIGLWKREVQGFQVRITPYVADAVALAEAGADLIALDATAQPHPEGSAADLIAAVALRTLVPILADVATAPEAERAIEAGAAFAASTLSGYTAGHASGETPEQPDLDLVEQMAARIGRERTIAEGRYRTADDVRAAFSAGALAVCVGGAITRPAEITRRIVRDLQRSRDEPERILD